MKADGLIMRCLRQRNFVIGLALTGLVIAAAALSFVWTPYSPTRINVPGRLATASSVHWFGTDHFGRDVFSVILVGSRNSILVGVVAVSIGVSIGVAIPNFWFALLLVLLFSITLGWAPSGGFPGWASGPAALGALALPAISLALPQAAILARVTRSAVLEVLREDFVRTARAKGLGKREVLWSHVLRNAMIPVMTVMGLQFANLLAGTIVIENVFYLPGLGRLIFQSIANRDLIVIRNCVMLLAAMVVVVNFVVDVLYAVIDPRIKVHDL